MQSKEKISFAVKGRRSEARVRHPEVVLVAEKYYQKFLKKLLKEMKYKKCF